MRMGITTASEAGRRSDLDARVDRRDPKRKRLPRLVRGDLEPSLADDVGKLGRLVEPPDRLYEVGVAVAVGGEDMAERGDHVEGPEVVGSAARLDQRQNERKARGWVTHCERIGFGTLLNSRTDKTPPGFNTRYASSTTLSG